MKEFKNDILNKVLIVVDGNQNEKLNAKDSAKLLSQKIKWDLIKISLDEKDNDCANHDVKERLFEDISEFAKNCKKRKGKKSWIVSENEKQ